MADHELPEFLSESQIVSQSGSQSGSQPELQPSSEAEEASGLRLILALDTCGPESTLAMAALTSDNLAGDCVRPIREHTLPARTAGSMLTGAMRDLLGSVPPSKLHAIVVVRGPGSFTGMRIGLSAAKALSEACALPLVAVSRLAVFAAASRTPFVALDAGRGRVYLGSLGGGPAQERLLDANECRELLTTELRPELRPDIKQNPSKGGTLDVEARLTLCEARLASFFPSAPRVAPPTALDAIRYAAARLTDRDWDDAATLDALYLWRPEQMLTSPAQPA